MSEDQHQAGRQGQHVLPSGGGAALGGADEQTHDVLYFPPRLIEDGAPGGAGWPGQPSSGPGPRHFGVSILDLGLEVRELRRLGGHHRSFPILDPE